MRFVLKIGPLFRRTGPLRMSTSPPARSPKSLLTSPMSSLSFRRVSPLTVILLASALVYSGLLVKRAVHVRTLNRQRRSAETETDAGTGTGAEQSFNFFDIFSSNSKSEPKIEELDPPLTPKPLNQNEVSSSPDRELSLEDLVPLYIITPTYPRPEQLAELTRMSQTLMNVRNMIWLVVEDAYKPTKQVEELLHRIKSIVPNFHLLGPMPEMYRRTKDAHHLPKGVSNRNKGLEWILKYGKEEGVIYFADDDNTYDLRLFWEIRKTKKLSIFPVGLVSGSPVSSPILENGELVNFYIGWDGNRRFPVDMAGFAFSVRHFKELSSIKKVSMPYIRGYEEDGFVKQLVPTRQDLEILVPDKILVWHTRTAPMAFKPFKKISKKEFTNSNLGKLNAYWCLFVGNFRCDDEGKVMANPNPGTNNNQNGKAANQKKGAGFKVV